MKKQLLYFDEFQYNWNLNQENEYFKILNNLIRYCAQALGDVDIDHIALIDNPRQYITDQYFDLYLRDKIAPHLEKNKEKILEQDTGVNLSEVSRLKESLKTQPLRKEFQPTITKEGFKSNLKKEAFNRYLAPEKEEAYNNLKEFCRLSNTISKEVGMGVGQFLIGGFRNFVVFEGESLEVQKNKFVL